MRPTVLLDSGVEHLALAAAVPQSPAAPGALLYYGDTLYRSHQLLGPRLRAFRLCDMLEAIAPRMPGLVVVLGPSLPAPLGEALTSAAEANGSRLVFIGEPTIDTFAARTGVREVNARDLALTDHGSASAHRVENFRSAFRVVSTLRTPRRWPAPPYDVPLDHDGEPV